VTRPPAPRERVTLLSRLETTSTFTVDCQDLLEVPWRPARETGADHSVPRPPPV
jgi:hypothetical protein